MKKNIYYFSNYKSIDCERGLTTQPSAINKSSYIIKSLKEAGYNIYIYSTAEGGISDMKIIPSKLQIIDNNECVYYPIIIGRSNIFAKIVSKALLYLQVIFYLIFRVKKDDVILVYHSLTLSVPIKIVRCIFKRNIYFEVEEIYNACYGKIKRIDDEVKYLSNANGYILVNDIIAKKCNFVNKHLTCYGAYDYIAQKTIKKDTSKIYLIYAGLIDSVGSDAYLAVDLSKYLPNNYHLYILGYGTNSNIKSLINYIDQNKNNNTCSVSYEGCLTGDEYINFLSQCDIGLCTRVLEDKLSDYTFPSKVMVYMCNNIIPVCTPLTCIKESKICNYVIYSDDASAESISSAIMKIDLSRKKEYKNLVISLHEKFVSDLSHMF